VFPWFSIWHNAWSFEVSEVCPWWVPRELKDWEEINKMGLFLQHLLWYADEGEHILNRIITGDESWVHHYQSESRCASVQWKQPSSPCSTKQFKDFSISWEGYAYCILGFSGSTVCPFSEVCWNVYFASYCEVLLKMWDAICSNFEANWHERYCFITAMPDPIQPE
jgi:hypothetical protein